MVEDFDDHRRVFDACPERVEGAAMVFKAVRSSGSRKSCIERPLEIAFV
jgi:hypothetical protein